MSPSHNLRATPNYQRPSTIALPPPLSTNDLIDAHRPPKRCKSPSGNLRATTTDTCLSLPPLPSLGSSPPNHHPLYPIATSPLDPSIALSLVLHPSTPHHPAPSIARPSRPHSNHRSAVRSIYIFTCPRRGDGSVLLLVGFPFSEHKANAVRLLLSVSAETTEWSIRYNTYTKRLQAESATLQVASGIRHALKAKHDRAQTGIRFRIMHCGSVSSSPSSPSVLCADCFAVSGPLEALREAWQSSAVATRCTAAAG